MSKNSFKIKDNENIGIKTYKNYIVKRATSNIDKIRKIIKLISEMINKK